MLVVNGEGQQTLVEELVEARVQDFRDLEFGQRWSEVDTV